MVAAIHVRCVVSTMLAAKALCDVRGETTNDDTLGVYDDFRSK